MPLPNGVLANEYLKQLQNKKDNETPSISLDDYFDTLTGPAVMSLFTQQDISTISKIITKIPRIQEKKNKINEILTPRGYQFLYSGTNRVLYSYLDNPNFIIKIALDNVGQTDSPREYINQKIIKPYCCKIFDVDPTGTIATIEKVVPITTLEEFMYAFDWYTSIIFHKFISIYATEDLAEDKFMNFGIRQNPQSFCVLDFPYIYKIDHKKLVCNNKRKDQFGNYIYCGGAIDYTYDFNSFKCTRCGKKYTGIDLIDASPDIAPLLKIQDGKVIFDSDHDYTYSNPNRVC